jgi:DNA-binding NarL/FixJ family response regulator
MILVQVQLARGRWEAAARLLGAAEAIGAGVSSHISTSTYESVGAALRAHLDAERFTAAWEVGHALAFDEAVAAALAIAAVSAPTEPPPPPETTPLTRREREVARLLAQGKSDRAIAAALFISIGTVGGHVHHILEKLDLQSRHQVAAWFVMHETRVNDLD